ncbi:MULTISPECIES: hypothetical protein [Xanthomonas]|uniref:hypothetical protein n=1 Tax=Xanthomonas TaxID=338 RepID=UPI001AD9D994|nr:hypothetical protein [Xanthomonas phaseoli]MBO9767879.1 hypothetical protein [Xanthomonas phaseoli pv. dieffenbachiae]MBO9777720.1 hypothetical protein [Xanthomonas phaseoli pv. dieffenbachiae]MBO9779125.1 hypothetical protein [Xanthomonas phaseoli pv. dieffenbachiae]MBO9795062.1 hypothetical protein [Xanthomonas phaseoli pv. dieffenbachiae]MBO9801972.1 hypothetical protein [Xanthomonas phaseoli pv. dieffenbachiae]
MSVACMCSPIAALAAVRFDGAGMVEQATGAAAVVAHQPRICPQFARACARVFDANAWQGAGRGFPKALLSPAGFVAHADATHGRRRPTRMLRLQRQRA